MTDHEMKLCPHYQIYSEALQMDGPAAYLAIRRCMLTERLVRFLEPSDEGRLLAEKMVIHTQDGRKYAFVGPDLESVTQMACNVPRCEARCTPAYQQVLRHFGLEDPDEENVTCTDAESETTETAPNKVRAFSPR